MRERTIISILPILIRKALLPVSLKIYEEISIKNSL